MILNLLLLSFELRLENNKNNKKYNRFLTDEPEKIFKRTQTLNLATVS